MKLVAKILRQNISIAQFAAYTLASLVGLAIIMTAVKFYCDLTTEPAADDDTVIGADYIVISRRVPILAAFSNSDAPAFSEADIAELEAQPWVRGVGAFTNANFDIYASVSLGGRGLSTALFFESIPDRYIDITPEGWSFDPADPTVPVIISKDYLALYNFGFAASRGLPQLSEEIISQVPLAITLRGNGRSDSLPGRIVGFSSRLNTVAVPEAFMIWANSRYGDGRTSDPSRLIVEVTDPADPAIHKYLDSHDIEAAGDRGSGRTGRIASVITTVASAVGAVIACLALIIVSLSIFLLVRKNRRAISDLIFLGYTAREVSTYYKRLIITINACVFAVATAIMLAASWLWHDTLAAIGLGGGSPLSAIVIGAGLTAVITLVNTITIARLTAKY
ncbi:MAG: ABC transporter permease [Muribaculaceae bacterium]